MKILDKVIKAFECCDHGEPDSRCEDCPYNGIGSCCLERENDALQFLQELHHILNNTVWVKSTKEENGYWKLPRLPETGNDPLTWDELKEMGGKPVWVEEIEDDKILFGQWDIISGFGYSENFDLIDYENPIIDFYRSGNRTKIGLGKTWQAYRKERE